MCMLTEDICKPTNDYVKIEIRNNVFLIDKT